jgi:hypothetical protein
MICHFLKRTTSIIKILPAWIIILLTSCILIGCKDLARAEREKPRTIVTTDGEVDDMDSFIRFLLYSNEFNVEGLIYTSSMWHYAGDGQGTLFTSEMPMTSGMYGPKTDLRWTGTEWMQKLIDKYAEVYPNLMKHDDAYPSPEYLKSIIRIGNIDFEGEMDKDTEGSDLIKSILLDNEPGKVYIQMWGGTNTTARALKSIEDQYNGTPEWDEIYKKVSGKAVLYNILNQDATYRKYISVHWPGIMIINNTSQFGSLAYWWYRVVPFELLQYLSGSWFSENIKFNHGPLLENYYLWGDGQFTEGDPEDRYGDPEEAVKQKRNKYDFISEGDSPSYLVLLDLGLRNIENPSYGGLGGRFSHSDTIPSLWQDGRDVRDFDPYSGRQETSYPQVRWLRSLQNDFAARANWCVSDFSKANHAPVVKLNQPDDIKAKPGKKILLGGEASDPDGNNLKFSWWQYKEAGTYPGMIEITDMNNNIASVIVPPDAVKGQTIHLILEVSDDGTPELTRYRRVIITVN